MQRWAFTSSASAFQATKREWRRRSQLRRAEAFWRMLLYLLLYPVLLIGRSEAQNDDWIDPTDMLNYDAASGTMRKPDEHVNQDNFENNRLPSTKVAEENLMEISRCQTKLDSVTHKLDEYEKKYKVKLHESNSIHVFRRYLNKILNEVGRLGLPNDNTREVHYDAEIILTRQSVNEINKFLKEEDWKSASLDEAVNSILINCRPHDYEAWKWKFEDTFGVDPYNVFMVLLCLASISVIIATELWTHVSWLTQMKRLMIISFLISFGWNWMYLYKMAFAQHQSEVAKMGNVDTVCVEKMRWTDSFWEYLRTSFTFQDDPCQKYYETLLVNPILFVPPTKALAVTFTNFITEPLKHVGQGIGEFIRALMKEIPILLQIPVLIIMAGATLIFCYGAGRSVTALRSLPYQERPQPPALPPRDGNQSPPMLQPKQSGADGKAGYLTGNTESIPGGPYDRGDASRRDMQTKSDCDRKHNIEVVQAGSTLDVPAEEHSKLATKNELNPKEEKQANDVMEKTNTDSDLDKTNIVEPSQVPKHPESNGNETKHSSSEDGIMKQNVPEAPEFQGKEKCGLEESRERIIETLNPSVSTPEDKRIIQQRDWSSFLQLHWTLLKDSKFTPHFVNPEKLPITHLKVVGNDSRDYRKLPIIQDTAYKHYVLRAQSIVRRPHTHFTVCFCCSPLGGSFKVFLAGLPNSVIAFFIPYAIGLINLQDLFFSPCTCIYRTRLFLCHMWVYA